MEIWTGVTDAWLTHSLTTLKDSATQLLIKYKSGALVTQFPIDWLKRNFCNFFFSIRPGFGTLVYYLQTTTTLAWLPTLIKKEKDQKLKFDKNLEYVLSKSSNCALHLHCMFFPSMRAADRTWVHLFQGGLKNTFSLVYHLSIPTSYLDRIQHVSVTVEDLLSWRQDQPFDCFYVSRKSQLILTIRSLGRFQNLVLVFFT